MSVFKVAKSWFDHMISYVLKKGVTNIGYLFTGNVISQFIRFIGLLYIARILGPENYGLYVIAGSFVGTFSFLRFEGINRVILRQSSRDLKKMKEFLEISTGLKNLFSLLSIIVTILIALCVPVYSTKLKIYIVILSMQHFTKSSSSFLNVIYQATEKMKYMSYFSVINSIIFVTLAFILLNMGFRVLALILINVFSNSVTLACNFLISRKFIIFSFFHKIKFDLSIIKPAFIFSLMGIFTFLSTQVDLVMISFLSDSQDVGIYSVAYNIVRQGALIKGIVSVSLFPIIVKRFEKGGIKLSLLLKYSTILFCSVIFIAVIIGYFAEDIIVFAFGNEYEESGSILAVLIFYLAIGFAALPFTNSLIAANKEKISLAVQIITASMNIPLNYLLFIHYGLIGIAYATLIIKSFAGIFHFLYSMKILRKEGYLLT